MLSTYTDAFDLHRCFRLTHMLSTNIEMLPTNIGMLPTNIGMLPTNIEMLPTNIEMLSTFSDAPACLQREKVRRRSHKYNRHLPSCMR